MIRNFMFGFKKKQCSVCQSKDVINLGQPLGHLCETHMLEAYKTRFLAHKGRKIIIPPAPPGKYISYHFETISRLKSYGLSTDDIAPLEKLFSKLSNSACYVTQTEYNAKDFVDIDFLGTANWKQKTPDDAMVFILSALAGYMNSNGIALPPDGDEDIIFYPLRS